MDGTDIISLHRFAAAIGLGLLIGVVRERAHPDPEHGVAGVRTHLLAALAGALGATLGTAVLVTVLVLLGAMTMVAYHKTADDSPGITGEVALPLTALLAALAQQHPGLAAGLAVVVAGALAAKQPLHLLVREKISEQELQDGLLLAGAALVVLPLLPSEPVDPWGALVPARLWRLVVLILAVGMIGHLALRLVGARWGLPVAGFIAGFASSTAAVAGFGQRARAEPTHVDAAAAGVQFASIGSLCLYAGVIGTASPPLLRLLVLPFAAGGAATLVVASVGMARSRGLEALPADGQRAFRLRQALLLGGLMALLLLASALLQEQFGSAGVLAASAVVAAIKIHAAAASLSQMAVHGQLGMLATAWGLVLMLAVAGAAKSVLAFFSGGAGYGWRVAFGQAVLPAAAAVVLALETGF